MKILTLILGLTGSGKSCSLRNLGANTVVYTWKTLPFKNKDIKTVSTNSANDLLVRLKRFKNNSYPEIQNIVIDSFGDFSDQLMAECSAKYKGFGVYNAYNAKMHDLFQTLKAIENKFIFVIANPEIVQFSDSSVIFRTPVHGRFHKGKVETVVSAIFYSDTKRMTNGKGVEYLFLTNTDSRLPAKTPLGMYEEIYIENDIAKVVEVYKNFYAQEAPVMNAVVAA